jgi:hypothetical protein
MFTLASLFANGDGAPYVVPSVADTCTARRAHTPAGVRACVRVFVHACVCGRGRYSEKLGLSMILQILAWFGEQAHLCARPFVQARAHARTHAYTHTHTHPHPHLLTHTHTHTHIHTSL